MSDGLTVDITVEDPRWSEVLDLQLLAEAAIAAGLGLLPITNQHEVSILAADDARIAALNADFRDKSQPTNVLSWPAEELRSSVAGDRPSAPTKAELGDIALAFETCRREAAENGVGFHEHVTHLVLHGLLHLLGYDHEEDEDATLMQSLETQALAQLGVADPY